MKLKFDWHTHTTFSHGKGTVEDNVKAAVEKGLESIAISDHGPGHFGYGFKAGEIPALRAEIDRVQALCPQVKVYMSVEANIINESGELDIPHENLGDFDFVLAGYHFGTIGESFRSSMNLHRRNLAGNLTKRFSDSLVEKNTELVINTLKKNDIRVLTHPGDKGRVDIAAVAEECAKRGTYMEISHRHLHLTVDEIRKAQRYDVQFIVGSDAHRPSEVGNIENAIQKIRQSGIDLERIVNLEP